MGKTLIERLKSFGLPFVAIPPIEEAVNALNKYDELPVATKDSLQDICDIYNVNFVFAHKRERLLLKEIFTQTYSMYLHPDDPSGLKKSQQFLKNSTSYVLRPFANNKLELMED